MASRLPFLKAGRKLRLAAWGFLAVALLGTAWAGLRAYRTRRLVHQQVKAEEERKAVERAAGIGARMAAIEAVAEALGGDLEGPAGGGALQALVEARLDGAPEEVAALGVCFDGSTQPAAAALRDDAGVRRTAAPAPDAGPGWSEPHRSRSTGLLVVDFARGFHCARGNGRVYLEISLEALQKRVRGLVPQGMGYGVLFSAKGTYLADPRSERVLGMQSLAEVARETGEPGRQRMAEAIQAGRRVFTASTSGLNGQPAWTFLEPVGHGGWFLATVLLEDELPLVSGDWAQHMALLVTCGMALGWALLVLGFGGRGTGPWALRRIGAGGALLLAAGIAVLFREAYVLPNPRPPHETLLMDPLAVVDFEERHEDLQVGLRTVPAQFIPTGVFLRTLETPAPGLVKVTGHIWQRYPRTVPREARGLILPEALSADIRLEQEVPQGAETVLLYSFAAVVRQEGGRADDYPFDRTRIRLRLWPKVFFGTQTLVPDLSGYTAAASTTLPGVDRDVTLPGWAFSGSEFASVEEAYNANFGIRDFAGQRRSPELVFNLTLRRHFLSPFIAGFLPLAAVAGLLYILLLSSTREPGRIPVIGYNYLNLLRTLIGLFFSLIVAQFNVRSRIPASGVVNLEWFYFTLYGFILLISGLALRFAQGREGPLHDHDQQLPKAAFWPLLLGIYYLIALRFLA